ncbi:MAG TPA: ATP-binding protein [Allocoleopsis sp.]
MEFKEILRFADHALYKKTGKHLNNLQSDILEGHKYAQIAEKHQCTTDYVGSVASDLWKFLSDELGEKINKSNVHARLENAIFNIISDSPHTNNNINYCPHNSHSPDIETQKTPHIETPYIDLDDAPCINFFYGRTQQLNDLEKYIFQQKARLIAIFGLSGIGKTSLTLQLIENVKENFDFVLWRNLQYFPHPQDLLQELIDIFLTRENQDKCQKPQLRTLINYLKKYRCLIVLDDLQYLFVSGELSGQYQLKSQEYQKIFKKIAEVNHKSCVLLLSQEKPREIDQLETVNPAVLSLELKGLDSSATGILKFQGLQPEQQWLNLIDLYQGHPHWLHLISTMIQQLAQGKITDIFIDNCILLTEDLKDCLNEIYQNLAPVEKTILSTLAKENQSITLEQFKILVNIEQAELLEGLRSLSKRCLIETLETPEFIYKINPIMGKFILSKNSENYHNGHEYVT